MVDTNTSHLMIDMPQAEQDIADDRMRAEIAKLLAETKPISLSTLLVPFLAAAGMMGTTAALVALILG